MRHLRPARGLSGGAPGRAGRVHDGIDQYPRCDAARRALLAGGTGEWLCLRLGAAGFPGARAGRRQAAIGGRGFRPDRRGPAQREGDSGSRRRLAGHGRQRRGVYPGYRARG
ncbi:hypothetical protein G6F31_020900 [Rhizopus arrhizus]|nr:hypothetical protein G6F31_020900 [Rhizopus arrhizus]